MKLFFSYIILVFLVSGIVFGLNHQYPNHFKYVDDKVVDIFFNARDELKTGDNVVVVDIDDRSLNEIGQWPWSRNTMAKLIENINSMSPSCIGYGIIFSEEDRTSPSHINPDSSVALENYDETLAMAIENSDIPIILGYSFLDTPPSIETHETPYIPAIIKNKVDSKNIGFYEPPNALLNIPIIQDSAYSSGFLNSISDENGRIVYMPLVMQYKGQFFPSLALELVRTIYSAREINIEKNNVLGNYITLANIKIPVDETGSKFVNYVNPEKSFLHISAVDILNKNFNNFLISDISSKVVLVGSNASGLTSRTPTPFNKDISAIDIQANVVENILSNNYVLKPVWEQKFQYIATIVVSLLIFTSIFLGSALVNVILATVSAVASYLVLKYFFDEMGYIINSTYLIEAILLSLIISTIAHFIKNKSDMSNIKGKFASKVSKEVMEDLLDASGREGDLSSKRKDVTIFFSDIKSFTKITEKINDPDKLTKYINRYMDAMTKNIMYSGGTVDKFMGDAIMAYWNAPYEVGNHSDKAVTSAIEQIQLLEELNELNIKEKMPVINSRIGINAGEAFVGEVGGELRSDYTIMGKSVNHTAVLEQVGKYYNTEILISQSVKDNLKEDYTMMLIDIIQVDGTSDAFNIYQVFGKGKANEFIQEDIDNFEKAIMLYRDAQFDDAILIFRNLYLKDDILNKRLCETYIQRCEINAIAILGGEFNPIQSINKALISGS
jgi:adenylate cyclase